MVRLKVKHLKVTIRAKRPRLGFDVKCPNFIWVTGMCCNPVQPT